jgi:hypothetical protein
MNGACTCLGKICSAGDNCCATGCAHLDDDPANCGVCGKTCAPGETCAGGHCLCASSVCTTGQECCGGTCVADDVMNCGACGIICMPGEMCTGTACQCMGGRACVGSELCCPAAGSAPGGCYDKLSDPTHCGNCTTVCAPGSACVQGVCQQTTCVPPCTAGNTCVGTVCRCNGSGACNNGESCCPSGCQNLLTDPANCGACGHACDKLQLCCSGACIAQDNNNCGSCGNKCGTLTSCCACTKSCNGIVTGCPTC